MKTNKFTQRFLSLVEKGGNALPNPVTLFALLALLVVIVSWLFSMIYPEAVSFYNARTHQEEEIAIRNLLSIDGLHLILTKMVTYFTGFAPLGTVLVAMLGIGIAEESGLINAVLRKLVSSTPKVLLTAVVVFSGVLSNVGSEVGYVLLVPLGAMMFHAVGRHPLAGLAAAFAGVSGGYSANLLLGTVDPLLSGISQEAANIIDPTATVNPACNYYFMVVSTFLITLLGTWVTEKIVIPRLGEYEGTSQTISISGLTRDEKRGIVYSLCVFSIITAFVLWGTIPENGFLRTTEGSLLDGPFFKGIVAMLFLYGVSMGIAYGIGAKTIQSEMDVINGMTKSMKRMSSYVVLVFFAALFVGFFNDSNTGKMIAFQGAKILKEIGMGKIPLIISLVFVTALFNLLMGSASAKWAIMAPIFVPMFMQLGFTPEFTQLAYRVGDSTTNIISPMMSYFAMIIVFIQEYDKKAGIGTLVSMMLPYSIAFFIGWILLLIAFMMLSLPIGPGAEMLLK